MMSSSLTTALISSTAMHTSTDNMSVSNVVIAVDNEPNKKIEFMTKQASSSSSGGEASNPTANDEPPLTPTSKPPTLFYSPAAEKFKQLKRQPGAVKSANLFNKPSSGEVNGNKAPINGHHHHHQNNSSSNNNPFHFMQSTVSNLAKTCSTHTSSSSSPSSAKSSSSSSCSSTNETPVINLNFKPSNAGASVGRNNAVLQMSMSTAASSPLSSSSLGSIKSPSFKSSMLTQFAASKLPAASSPAPSSSNLAMDTSSNSSSGISSCGTLTATMTVSSNSNDPSNHSTPSSTSKANSTNSDNTSTTTSTGTVACSSTAKSHHTFNIEYELIKYTKNLKLNTQPYFTNYKLGVHVRNGGFSEIYEGQRLRNNEKVIIKLIPKHKTKNWLMVNNRKFPAEILLHKMCNGINGVVRMLEFYEQEHDWIIVMPKLRNSMDLFDYLESKSRGRLSEKEACEFFRQLIRINIDLLNTGVVHRDIKSENLLVDMESMKLVLIDFGASAIYRAQTGSSSKETNNGGHFYTDFHGTRQYKPPEYITHKKYTAQASTIWTLGILLYDMCNGQLPFETEQEILDYDLKMKTTVSEEYKQLLFDCLKLDPTQRPSLNNLLNYSWFHLHTNISTGATNATSNANSSTDINCASSELNPSATLTSSSAQVNEETLSPLKC